MSVQVNIPTMLRNYANGQASIDVEGATVGEVLNNLNVACSGIGERVLDDNGNVRRFINVYLDEEDIRFLSDLDTEIADSKELSIVPAVAGG
tara:strand:+ start:299 stop:574 length:276 start_codon:yes stop_codon:yes gene_type:complete